MTAILNYPNYQAGRGGLIATYNVSFSSDPVQFIPLGGMFQGDPVYPYSLRVSNLTSASSFSVTVGNETDVVPPYSILTIDIRGATSVTLTGTSGQSCTVDVTNYAMPFGVTTPGPGPTTSTPSDPYFSNVIGLYHFDAPNNTPYGVNSSKASVNCGTLNCSSPYNTLISTSNYQFGTSSLYATVNGASNWTPSNSISLTFPLTVEASFYVPTTTYVGQNFINVSNVGFGMGYYSGTGQLNPYFNGIYTGISLNFNTWYQLAMVIYSTSYAGFFINGKYEYTLNGSFTPSTSFLIQPAGIFYLDELRLTNGIARYSNDYTPSTTAFLNQ